MGCSLLAKWHLLQVDSAIRPDGPAICLAILRGIVQKRQNFEFCSTEKPSVAVCGPTRLLLCREACRLLLLTNREDWTRTRAGVHTASLHEVAHCHVINNAFAVAGELVSDTDNGIGLFDHR